MIILWQKKALLHKSFFSVKRGEVLYLRWLILLNRIIFMFTASLCRTF